MSAPAALGLAGESSPDSSRAKHNLWDVLLHAIKDASHRIDVQERMCDGWESVRGCSTCWGKKKIATCVHVLEFGNGEIDVHTDRQTNHCCRRMCDEATPVIIKQASDRLAYPPIADRIVYSVFSPE